MLRRLALAATLLLHIAVVGLVPLADARLEAAGLGSVAHIEPLGDGPCDPAHHDHADCQLCRVAGWGAALFPGRADLPHVSATGAPDAPPSPAPPRALRGAPLGPRAPPTV